MDRLGEDVRKALAGAGPAQAGVLPDIVRGWPTLVGEAIARAAWPQRIARDGTLHVATASSTWAFELGRMAPEILQRLRTTHGADAPAGLRFAPGPLPEPDLPAAPADASGTAPAGAAERAEAATLTAGIDDPELRELVARAAAASLARAHSGRRL